MNQQICRLFFLMVPMFLSITLRAAAIEVEQCKKNIAAKIAEMDQVARSGPYHPNWESLCKHPAEPEWFRDGKIGIYFHWGVYTVPAYGNEWYMRRMHILEGPQRKVYEHHRDTWGEPDKFGYHDFVPLFTAEHFDAEEWADLFVKAGARWAGPVCEHHDGYSMWDSEMTPWNAADTGPKQDTTGKLARAIKARGLKFVTTFHHERTRNWIPRVEGWPTTSSDPRLQMLYMNIDETLFYQIFQAKLGEVVDKYQPDLIWFDGAMGQIPESYHLNFLAYYFNRAAQWNKPVMVTTKKRQYPEEVSVLDYEKGRSTALTPYPWLNDDTISTGSWGYTDSLQIKPASVVLHDFIDAVSKSGHLLLNISPKSDGTIPQDQRDCLLAIGKWLELNGEAIYNTRPWLEFGEGPTRLKRSGSFSGSKDYSAKDIRYTSSKDGKTVYAIALGWPDDGKLSPAILQVDASDGGQVELLGAGTLEYSVDDGRLTISTPSERPCDYAYAFKLTGFDLSLAPEAAQAREQALAELLKESPDPCKPNL